MKTLILVAALFVAAVLAEDKDLEKSETYGYPVGYGAYGHGYGGHGYLGAGYGAYGHGALGAHSRYGAYGHGAHGLHANVAHRNLNAYGAHGGYGGHYRDIGAYARNKGAGYTRAYAYDKQDLSRCIYFPGY
ncbi:shematrin-like protein 2 [Limulus polyphemus]|uniref:Shematrin-like protein 2 n=1 Tax=Limulus polyphemus TaxID=6850 RepID=A0ABM1RZ05_LIMPO|nr:shematrin-like protein 2 [Limulus polyphemus]